jgi:hypothetical protein
MRPMILAAALLALPWICANGRAGVALQSFNVNSPAPGVHVFSTLGPQGAPGLESGPGATVAWPVSIDVALLETLPASLIVNFPDRAPVTLKRIRSEQRGSGAFLWTGRGSDCSALFRVAASGLKGTISCINAPYGINHLAGSSSLRLTRYDDAGNGTAWEPPFPGLPSDVEPSGPAPMPSAGKPDTTVDVLVLYNGTIMSINIWEDAQDQVDAIQHAMDLSTTPGQPVIAQVKLAGAARISRTVSNDPAGDLQALRTDPEAIALRDYWAGDVILYLTTGIGNLHGIANIPGWNNLPLPGPDFAQYAIAVSLAHYADSPGEWVAAHEFAHTFGANHNSDHLPVNTTPVQPYAFGHWARELGTDTPAAARTIMSYVNECIQVVNPCPRIPHYSNPGVTVDGWFTTGSNLRNNASLIKLIAPIQAQYRPSLGRIFKHGFE